MNIKRITNNMYIVGKGEFQIYKKEGGDWWLFIREKDKHYRQGTLENAFRSVANYLRVA